MASYVLLYQVNTEFIEIQDTLSLPLKRRLKTLHIIFQQLSHYCTPQTNQIQISGKKFILAYLRVDLSYSHDHALILTIHPPVLTKSEFNPRNDGHQGIMLILIHIERFFSKINIYL